MDNNVGEMIAESFWATLGAFLTVVWEGIQVNPLPYLAIGVVILAGVLLPAQRSRRRRRY